MTLWTHDVYVQSGTEEQAASLHFPLWPKVTLIRAAAGRLLAAKMLPDAFVHDIKIYTRHKSKVTNTAPRCPSSLPTQSLCIAQSSFIIIPFLRELGGLRQHRGCVPVLPREVNFSLNKCLKGARLKGTGVNYRWAR